MDMYQEALAWIGASGHNNTRNPQAMSGGEAGGGAARSKVIREQSEKDRREAARDKISSSMSSLASLRAMMLNGSLDEASRQVFLRDRARDMKGREAGW